MSTWAYPVLRPEQVQQPDILGQVGKVVALRQALAMAPLQLQQAQMQVQQQQLEMKSEQALMQAFQEGGGDPDKVIQIAKQSGNVLPQQILQYQQTQIKFQNDLADRDRKQLDLMEDRAANLREQMDPVKDLPPDQQLPAANDVLNRVRSDPNAHTTYGIDSSQLPQSITDMGQFWNFEAQLNGQQKAVTVAKNIQDQREAQARTQQLAGQHGPIGSDQLAQLNQVLATRAQGVGLDPTAFQLRPTYDGKPVTYDDYSRMHEALQQAAIAKAMQTQHATQNWLTQQGQLLQAAPYLATPGQGGVNLPALTFPVRPPPGGGAAPTPPPSATPVGPQGAAAAAPTQAPATAQAPAAPPPTTPGLLQGEAYIRSLPPVVQNNVRSIVTGALPPPAPGRGGGAEMRTMVTNADPSFNEQRYELRQQYTKDPEIGAINTALGHLNVLGQSIDALQNGNVRVLNAIANRLGVETGNTAQTTFNTIVHRVGPEIASAYLKSGGTGGERGTDVADFDPSLGPAQLKDNVGITVKLLRSKIASKENQWDQNFPPQLQAQYPDLQFQRRFIMPEAQQTLNQWAPKTKPPGGAPSDTIYARDPQGKLHQAPRGTPLPKGWTTEGPQ